MQHQLYHIEHSCIIYQDAYGQGLKEKKDLKGTILAQNASAFPEWYNDTQDLRW